MIEAVADDSWRPLGFEGSDATAYDALHDGVPNWMLESFWSWIKARFSSRSSSGMVVLNIALFRQCERICRLYTGFSGSSAHDGVRALRQVSKSTNADLRIADFLLATDRNAQHAAPALDELLRESGSAFRVGERAGKPGLVRRVPEGVQQAADEVMRSAGTAGLRLSEAWGKAFGVDPDPSAAYALAVRAVEDASIPVVVPEQSLATLGHVIRKLANDGDWSLPLTREDPNATTQSIVLGCCRAIWKGHHDRHGGVPDAPMSVSQQEAETAVTLAVSLVQWFCTTMVIRR